MENYTKHLLSIFPDIQKAYLLDLLQKTEKQTQDPGVDLVRVVCNVLVDGTYPKEIDLTDGKKENVEQMKKNKVLDTILELFPDVDGETQTFD